MIHFCPPGNPLEAWAKIPFRPAWRRRTAAGIVCYFCGCAVVPGEKSPVPCCEAAHFWVSEQRKITAKKLIETAVRRLT